MTTRYADLHIHSYYSDGTLSPQDIIEIALSKQIDIIAITDHNELNGSRELMRLNKPKGFTCIPGVELDAMYCNTNIHILAFNVDLYDNDFIQFVSHNAALLEQTNIELVKRLSEDYNEITLEEYKRFEYNRRKGGWKALHYFLYKGIATTLEDSFKLYFKYGSYNKTEFPAVEDVIKHIHLAGGKAILAHPGRVFKSLTIEKLKETLDNLFILGIDGVECYYPSHTEDQLNICLNVCIDNNKIITSGSDCHGDFEKTEIGEMNTSIEVLNNIELILSQKTNSKSVN